MWIRADKWLAIIGFLPLGVFGGIATAGPSSELSRPEALLVQSTRDLSQTPPGIREAYVRGIQLELLAHGYNSGPVDGIAGAETRAAIREYQIDAKLVPNGEPSQELLDHLKFVQPKVNKFGEPVIGVVLDVQRELARRGYYLGPHDGLSGPATRRAVRRFGEDARLVPGGPINTQLLQQIRDAPAELGAGKP